MTTDRKFFKTIVTVEVLSEDVPVEFDNLQELHYMITSGDDSGVIKSCIHKKITGKQAAQALIKQGSDPGFFLIDKDGNDL